MEKEGLSRALQFLHDNALTVGMLITDRHKQINKFMNQDYSEVEHRYDVWHVAKGKYHTITIFKSIIFQLVHYRIEEEITKGCQI